MPFQRAHTNLHERDVRVVVALRALVRKVLALDVETVRLGHFC